MEKHIDYHQMESSMELGWYEIIFQKCSRTPNSYTTYKHGLLVTMLYRAHRLSSSSWAHFSEECERLTEVFRKLRYPNHLIDSVINRFITWRVAVDQPKQHTDDAIWIVIP